MSKLERVVSFRLSDEDYAWFEKQGNVNDVCRRVALEQRDRGELSPKVFKMMRQLLESVKSVDEKASEILSKLPEDDGDTKTSDL